MTNTPVSTHRGAGEAGLPGFLYGTAWKEERTRELTELALEVGFRGIDTANQRKHYVEAAVGEAVEAVLAKGRLSRADLFLQTKFTYARGQDHRMPYDPRAPFHEQVAQSFASSLVHLRTDRIDSYVLHGPATGRGLAEADWQVWRAMEGLESAGRVRFLGISNVAADQLEALIEGARVDPAFVQNRCYARLGWDRRIREICRAHDIIYQGFSLLTANRREIASPTMREMAGRTGLAPVQLIFCFAQQAGMLPLTGTTSRAHMQDDLAALDFALDEADVRTIAELGL